MATNATTVTVTLNFSPKQTMKAASKFTNHKMRPKRWSVTADISQKPYQYA